MDPFHGYLPRGHGERSFAITFVDEIFSGEAMSSEIMSSETVSGKTVSDKTMSGKTMSGEIISEGALAIRGVMLFSGC